MSSMLLVPSNESETGRTDKILSLLSDHPKLLECFSDSLKLSTSLIESLPSELSFKTQMDSRLTSGSYELSSLSVSFVQSFLFFFQQGFLCFLSFQPFFYSTLFSLSHNCSYVCFIFLRHIFKQLLKI